MPWKTQPSKIRNLKSKMRIATIDVGTNTALLLVAEVGDDGAMVPVFEAHRFVRLGEGVDATRRVGAPAMQRLREALLAYRETARAYGAVEIVVGATSASRDAQNRDELVDFVRRETGLRYEILSGPEEALWSFRGALSGIDAPEGPCAVIDIGGGSTEIVIGETAGNLRACHSLDVGSVRLTERFFTAQPPDASEVDRAEAFIRHLLTEAALPFDAAIPLISAAETPLLVALVDRGKASWKALGTAPVALDAGTVHRWRRRLLTMTYEDVLRLDADLMEGRADVFPAAVLLFDAVLRHFGLAKCRVSPHSLRHGLALRFIADAVRDRPGQPE